MKSHSFISFYWQFTREAMETCTSNFPISPNLNLQEAYHEHIAVEVLQQWLTAKPKCRECQTQKTPMWRKGWQLSKACDWRCLEYYQAELSDRSRHSYFNQHRCPIDGNFFEAVQLCNACGIKAVRGYTLYE